MSRRLRLSLIIGIVSAMLLVLAVLALYLAMRHEPAFYRQALEIDHAVLEKGSDRMLQRATRLVSDVKKRKRWEAIFTADDINGWLAVDMMKNHPNTLPAGFRDPRVVISATQITLACRFQENGVDSVLSLTVEPSMSEPNVIALRIVKARAGLLPLPLSRVLDSLRQSAGDMGLSLTWRRVGSDPVALLTLSATDDDRPVSIETLQLEEGKIYVSGSAGKR